VDYQFKRKEAIKDIANKKVKLYVNLQIMPFAPDFGANLTSAMLQLDLRLFFKNRQKGIVIFNKKF